MAAGQPQSRGQVHLIRSSLPYQVLLYLNGWYFAFFFIAQILIYIFKGETLPYPSSVLAADIIILIFMAAIEAIRLYFGQKGNLTERIMGVAMCIVFSIPALLGVLYNLLLQTYVLRIDVILASIQIVFLGLELIFGIFSIVTFARATSY